MKKNISFILVIYICLFLNGCGPIGDKTSSMSVIYGVTSALALLLVASYNGAIKKKDFWLQLLFASILIVNIGYFCLSMSSTLEEALLANRISYFGSVFLPLSMLMMILEQTKWKQRKWMVAILTAVSICIFFIAASPGYSDVYYASASLTQVNGSSVLIKEYGPLHSVYLYYLISYFAIMIGVIIHAIVKRKMSNPMHAIILAFAVFINIGVWMFGQLVHVPFEFLSVSYIISGFFILSLQLMLQQEAQTAKSAAAEPAPTVQTDQGIPAEKLDFFEASLPDLTPTERLIYTAYLEGKTTREVMDEQHIKENTLKYHNKNIYSKLGVSSKKELLEIAKVLKLRK
ncbi:MAG: hypothetical protein IKJ77_10040 [Firmicutes bacterium]|nr:hypothetical protein [Bacillota bacterium]